MYEVIGYISAVFIGIILSLIGGGGSILTVPVLVYILAIEPVLATAYSLFIVGTTSFVGAVKNIKTGNIDIKTGIVFSIPSLFAVYFTRRIIIPSIPQKIIIINDFSLSKETGIMLFFSLIMLLAATTMIYKRKEKRKENKIKYTAITLVVGVFTGLVGAGGGFLIIPALVLLGGLSMKKAIGTSLMIISVKSLIGFTGDLSTALNIDWFFLSSFCFFSVLGMGLGLHISKFIEGEKLKKVFGWFVLLIGLFVFIKELV